MFLDATAAPVRAAFVHAMTSPARCLAEAATVGDDLKLVRELSCLRFDALSVAVLWGLPSTLRGRISPDERRRLSLERRHPAFSIGRSWPWRVLERLLMTSVIMHCE
jgi:hypothetical protein